MDTLTDVDIELPVLSDTLDDEEKVDSVVLGVDSLCVEYEELVETLEYVETVVQETVE